MGKRETTPKSQSQQPNSDQDSHDKWLLAQSDADLKRVAKGLGKLARSKATSVSTSSSGTQSAKSGDMAPFTETDIEMARALGWM